MSDTSEFQTALDHVQDTESLLSTVGADRYDFGPLEEIGQKFNGLIGTFAFAKDQPGFCHFGRGDYVHRFASSQKILNYRFS